MKVTNQQLKQIIKEELKKALLTEAKAISFYDMLMLAKAGDKLSLNFLKDGYDWMLGVQDKPFKAGKTYEASIGKGGNILIFHETVGTFFNKWHKSKKTKEDMIEIIQKNVTKLTKEKKQKKDNTPTVACSILNCKKSTVTREGVGLKTISAIMADPDVMKPRRSTRRRILLLLRRRKKRSRPATLAT